MTSVGRLEDHPDSALLQRQGSHLLFLFERASPIQPQDVTVNYVPDLSLRAAAPAPLNQVLNAFPLPTPGAPDLGNGLTEFVGSWSTPSSIDSVSLRLDHAIGARNRTFFRYSQTPSRAMTRGNSEQGVGAGSSSPSVVTTSSYEPRTFTLGVTSQLAAQISNEIRGNLSSNVVTERYAPDNFGGAEAVNMAALQGLNPASVQSVETLLYIGSYGLGIAAGNTIGTQRQWNIVDNLSVSAGRHNLKVGFDWRRLTPTVNQGPFAAYLYFSEGSVAANSVDLGFGEASSAYYPLYTNLSAFLQDEWHLKPRLNLSLGLRWEVNPAPAQRQAFFPTP